jgi:hypothetical protein
MLKKSLLLLATAFSLNGAHAQILPCASSEMHKKLLAQHPELAQMEADMERQLQEGLRKIDYTKAAKTTFVDQSNNEDFWYDIPIVVHIIHDYNTYSNTFNGDFVTDDFIFEAVKDWNIVFAKQNADTADVIAPFKKWIGNPHIRLHLATIDPLGNVTKGITRRRSYLTYTGGDQAKFDGWSNTSYINIWFINKMSVDHSEAAAYAYKPSAVTYIPFYDGVISLAGYMNNGSKTINHELGHVLNLSHVWGDNNQPGTICGDDNVDDTPPTKGHNPGGCTASAIYDTVCSINYFKLYTDSVGTLELVDYPDTNNSQNIMDYTYCDKMFSKGQGKRMHLALNSDIGGRNNLWDSLNLIATGAMLDRPDLKPIPEFSVTNITGSSYLIKNGNFAFVGKDVKFTNFTMNDTVTALKWYFNDDPIPASTSLTNFSHAFTTPGWVKVTMTATGNHTGDSTISWEKALFVTDEVGTLASGGYFQEFNSGGDVDKWPIFNYFNNEFKWELSNTGAFDNTSIKYNGFDSRITPFFYPLTGSPKGDFDDFYSVPMDFTGLTSGCNLNFFYTGASRSSSSASINDSLYIDYSSNKGVSWFSLAKLGKGDIFNKGSMSTPYTPTGSWDWEAKTLPLPVGALTTGTVFRFRYKPGVTEAGTYSSGNNFYMDRIHFSPWPAEASIIKAGTTSVTIVPNPTMGDAFVIVNDVANTNVQLSVSDITGKVVFTTSEYIRSAQGRITIPASAIAVKGVYLVHTQTGNQTNTQKLVVY